MTEHIHIDEHSYLSGEESEEHWRVYGNEAEMINTDQVFDSVDTGFSTNPDYDPATSTEVPAPPHRPE